MDNLDNIKKFEELLLSVERDGINELVEFIRKSDFYKAPASTRFHSSYEGGLLQHSLNVYQCLVSKYEAPIWSENLKEFKKDSIILVSLLHDLCKIYFYEKEYRNKKIYSESGSKRDAGGRFDWETVETYTIDDKYPLGHGAKSVIFIQHFIKLDMKEILAIVHHMGFSEPKEEYNSVGKSMETCPLVLALHEADMEATYLMEETPDE